jgi:hypothetical protein
MSVYLRVRCFRFVFLGGGVFRASLEERPEDGLRVVEVIVHNVYEEAVVHQLRDDFPGR